MSKPPFKPLRLAPVEVEARELPGGGMLLRSWRELGPYPASLGVYLQQWARTAPERTFLAERTAGGSWRRVSFGAALDSVERIAGSLLNRVQRGLPSDRPVVILSDNGIDHALLAFGAMHVGIPVAPISTAYSLLSQDHAQLRYLLELTRPGLVYCADGERYAAALELVPRQGVELVVSTHPPADRQATDFTALLADPPGREVAARFAAVGPDTVAKILFTSGSTGQPKGVINTQRMLCSNQQAIAQGWPFLEDRPPVILDWLPWSHTFGGNHNVHMMLRNGGTLYIDAGKPAPGLFETTLRNLREVPSTIHFNVPRGFDMLIPHLERDRELREAFFRDLDMIFYAAAALPQHLWDRLERLAIATTGRRVPMLSAWGSTETAPSATQVHFFIERAGVIGVPGPGTEVKLAPAPGGAPGGHRKLELRVKGPNVTPGYWLRPDLAAEMFDEDGFLRMGDAGKLADRDDPAAGIVFDGRLREDFKLSSGVWVHVGALRTEAVAAGSPVIQDAVVTGHDRQEAGLLVFPNLAGCRSLCGEGAQDLVLAQLIGRAEVRDALRSGLSAHNAANPGSSRRICRVLLLAEPPSIDAGEITDKGYINQRAVLDRRAALVERLYGEADDPAVLRII